MTLSSPGGDTAATRFRIGTAHCDLMACVLVREGETHRLEPHLAGVLHLLARRGISPVTRDEFLETVWEEDGSDEALNQAISRLRRLLGDASLIRTLPRIGYSLSAPVESAGTLPSPAPTSPFLAWLRTGLGFVKRPFLTGLAVGVLVTALVASVFWPRTLEQEFEIFSGEPVDAGLTLPDEPG
jgi:DNA-binding winged helix-turn-helix (wHTH) protein